MNDNIRAIIRFIVPKKIRHNKIIALIRKIYYSIRKSFIYLYFCMKYSSFIKTHKVNENNTGKGHEKIIWRLWLQGEENAPEISKACFASLKRWYPDKKIISLDADNLAKYITIPDYINEKYQKGMITHTHYSDIIRLQLLIKYGGIWIDSTVFCTGRKFDYIMDLPLFAFKENSLWCAASSWFIVSNPNDNILTLTRDLLFQYWKDYDYMIDYFIFHMFFKMAANKYRDEWKQVPFFSNKIPHEMQREMYKDYSEEKMKYFAGISDFHKLTYKSNNKTDIESSIFQHIINLYVK